MIPILELTRQYARFQEDINRAITDVAASGHYILGRGRHVALHPSVAGTDETCRKIRDAFILGSERTPTQDIEYGIRQLVEMATRALSPGINEPFTAIGCIDRLGDALCQMTRRRIPEKYHFVGNKLRLITIPPGRRCWSGDTTGARDRVSTNRSGTRNGWRRPTPGRRPAGPSGPRTRSSRPMQRASRTGTA